MQPAQFFLVLSFSFHALYLFARKPSQKDRLFIPAICDEVMFILLQKLLIEVDCILGRVAPSTAVILQIVWFHLVMCVS